MDREEVITMTDKIQGMRVPIPPQQPVRVPASRRPLREPAVDSPGFQRSLQKELETPKNSRPCTSETQVAQCS